MHSRSLRLLFILLWLGASAGYAAQATPSAQVVQTQSLIAFIWLAMGMGALSLLTPCVFPMIPITVSYFTKHAAKSRAEAMRNAFIYSIGIILTFTALGLALALIFGAGGVNQLAANPWVNLLITAIFLGFALSLFGAYLIQIPPNLLGKLHLVSGKTDSGYIGTMLMGLTFTLTSFTCTAPFVGTLLVMASQGNWKWPLLGMLAFSTVFAIPFFVFALAPQLLSQLPKSGSWLNSVKVVMGFLEIAAAMKFLSNADMIWGWGIFTRQIVLAVWVAIGLLTVLYLLGKFQMSHDAPLQNVSALRAICAIVFLSISVWLTTGLFGHPLGEIESFLPPPPETAASGTVATNSASGGQQPAELTWILNDYNAALAQAKAQNKPIFIDFTGYTCTNCRWMEANIFPRKEVRSRLDKFIRVRLYTDGDGEVYDKQQQMEKDRFGTVALPLYAIISPADSPVATFAGLTRKVDEFTGFLAKGDGLVSP